MCPRVSLAGSFTAREFSPLVSGALTLLAAIYLAGVWLAARRRPARPWPASRTVAFLLGLGAVADLEAYNAHLAGLDR